MDAKSLTFVKKICFYLSSVRRACPSIYSQCNYLSAIFWSKFPSKRWLMKNIKRAEIFLKSFQGLGHGRYSPSTGRACWPAMWLSQEEWAVSFIISWDMGIQHDTPDCLSAQFVSESEFDQSKTEQGSPLTSPTFSWRMSSWKRNLKFLLSLHPHSNVSLGFLLDFSTFHPVVLFFI